MLLRDGRVVLREKRADDAEDDYSWRTDEELSRLDATRPLTISFDHYLRFYREEIQYPAPWSWRFGIDTPEGKHIGNCMIYDINHAQGQAELGIMIGDRDYWSQGYGTSAVITLVDHVFSTTELKRIYLHTLEWNTRARRSFQKAGFHEVKEVNRNGHTFVLMETWRHEWEKGKLASGQDDNS